MYRAPPSPPSRPSASSPPPRLPAALPFNFQDARYTTFCAFDEFSSTQASSGYRLPCCVRCCVGTGAPSVSLHTPPADARRRHSEFSQQQSWFRLECECLRHLSVPHSCTFNQVFQHHFTPASTIPQPLSSKIRTLNFVGIVCVMYIHSFNEEPVYLQPYTRPKENTFSVAIQLFLAGACLRFVVPFFFLVSGYLFFVCKVRSRTSNLIFQPQPHVPQSDDIPNVQFPRRLRARVWSIMVPFFAWQLTAILAVLLLLLWPAYKTNWPYSNYLQV